MTLVEDYVRLLERLQGGELALLRTHADRGLDETLTAFDLFTGLWWPLRQRSPRAPQRDVAWLVAKLYAYRPRRHAPDKTLANGLRRCYRNLRDERLKKSFGRRVDRLLTSSLATAEPELRWALDQLDDEAPLDWVKLIDDLWKWDEEATRLAWAQAIIGSKS